MGMPNKLSLLGIILARGGSKRLPGKNIRMLQGKPVLAWSIDAARSAHSLDKVMVSTDSSSIADVASRFGAEVPFLRPAELAGDDCSSVDAVLHALDYWHGHGHEFDAVILLEPTSPLRASGDIDAVAALLARHWDVADAVVSVGEVQLEKPDVMKVVGADGYLSKWGDAVPPAADVAGSVAYFPYGVAYAIKTAVLRRDMTFYPRNVMGYKIQRWQNYEIDDEFDFACVEAIIQHFKGELP